MKLNSVAHLSRHDDDDHHSALPMPSESNEYLDFVDRSAKSGGYVSSGGERRERNYNASFGQNANNYVQVQQPVGILLNNKKTDAYAAAADKQHVAAFQQAQGHPTYFTFN